MFLPSRPSRAFTLLELIVVIVILGILAAIAIPSFQRVIDTSKLEAAEATLAAVSRDTQALAGFDEQGFLLTYPHFEDAATELQSTALQPGTSAAGPKEGSRNFKASYGIWSFSPDADTINAHIDQSQVMTTATYLPGVGCAWAQVQASGGVKTWSELGTPVHECSGAGGDRSRKYKAPPTPTGLTVTWTAGYWKVDCTGTEPIDVYRNGKYVTTTNCPWTGGGSEFDNIDVIVHRPGAPDGPAGWEGGPGDYVGEGGYGSGADEETSGWTPVNISWDPVSLPGGTERIDLVHGGGVIETPHGPGFYQGPVKGEVIAYPVVGGVRQSPIPITVTPTPPPPAPVAEDASTGKRSTATWVDGYMTILWIPVTSTEEAPLYGYRLYRQQAPGEVWDTSSIGYQGPGPRLDANGYVQVFDASEFSSKASDVTLAPHPQDGTGSWCYRVSAYGPGGESALSERVCGSTDTIPGAPTDVTAEGGPSSALVSWVAPTYVGGAPITAYRAISTPDGKVCTTSGGLECIVTGLTAGVSYTFTVRAENSFGPGDPSQPSNAVVPRTSQTQQLSYTGAPQTWTVPAGVTYVQVTAQGGAAGALGGKVTTGIRVSPGEVLNVYVGGNGSRPAGGWNGGASGGSAREGTYGNTYYSQGGAGASDVRQGGTGLEHRVVIAGGGGGSANYSNGSVSAPGGAGGYPAGATGTGGGLAAGGGGGTQDAGGVGGRYGYSGSSGSNGGSGVGGSGGSNMEISGTPGGGGGGGWFGGGGGGANHNVSAGGGGGGSSHAVPSRTLGATYAGATSNVGGVVFTY